MDETYFDESDRGAGPPFDASLLREPLTDLPVRSAIVLSPEATVTDAMRAMQREHRGCVIITDDGTSDSKLTGIFTERDVLFRIVDRGRNPAPSRPATPRHRPPGRCRNRPTYPLRTESVAASNRDRKRPPRADPALA